MPDLPNEPEEPDTKLEVVGKAAKEFFLSLASHYIAALIFFGTIYLLFANLRFDYAVYAFGGLVAAFLVFVYWPRKK